MFVAWRKKPVKGSGGGPFLADYSFSHFAEGWRRSNDVQDWRPLACTHRGVDRVAWTPILMRAERRDGKPRQKLILSLPSIRSCCIKDRFNRAAWWHLVASYIEELKYSDKQEALDIIRDAPKVFASLRKVVPRPTPAGVRGFEAYRLEKEDEHERWKGENPWEGTTYTFGCGFRSRAGAEVEDDGPLDVLGLAPGATPAEIKARYRELSKIHHPDVPGGDAAEFRRLNAAYEAACAAAGRYGAA